MELLVGERSIDAFSCERSPNVEATSRYNLNQGKKIWSKLLDSAASLSDDVKLDFKAVKDVLLKMDLLPYLH